MNIIGMLRSRPGIFAITGIILSLLAIILAGISILSYQNLTLSSVLFLAVLLLAIPFFAAYISGFSGLGIFIAGGTVLLLNIIIGLISNISGIAGIIVLYFTYFIAAIITKGLGYA